MTQTSHWILKLLDFNADIGNLYFTWEKWEHQIENQWMTKNHMTNTNKWIDKIEDAHNKKE